jgi:hypothetical protein
MSDRITEKPVPSPVLRGGSRVVVVVDQTGRNIGATFPGDTPLGEALTAFATSRGAGDVRHETVMGKMRTVLIDGKRWRATYRPASDSPDIVR